ncbi:double-CXXCG motif protein [Corallococcus terminator]
MSRFFWVREDDDVAEQHGGEVHGAHKWKLPGAKCHTCGITWSGAGHTYPCVDLSALPEQQAYERARPEPFIEFARLREQVRSLAPAHAPLPPGTRFGPLVGTASGNLADFAWLIDVLLMHRDALERLQALHPLGLRGCRTELRWRKKNPPELLELQLEPHGRLHPDCIPSDVPPPCQTCGRFALSRPQAPILDGASLPTDIDLFRVGNFATMVIGTERFVEAVHNLSLTGLTFRELPTR